MVKHSRLIPVVISISLVLGVLYLGLRYKSSADKLAREGRGLLPQPITRANSSFFLSSKNSLKQESANLYSRLLFETSDDPNFRIRIKDLSIPPRMTSADLKMPADTIVEIITGLGKLTIENKEHNWKQGTIILVHKDVPMTLVNDGDREMIVRC